ncbi:hypothetical protein [Streptomyces sp. NPDC051569]|uniref:hypothetical protein n=1 Tax=Streptomyces sp. NPDC051569 TaxID=3365661 RepID=UPI0037B1B35B
MSRGFTGFEIERREAGTDTWSVALHKPYDRFGATVTVCDPLPADGAPTSTGPVPMTRAATTRRPATSRRRPWLFADGPQVDVT